MHVACWVRHPIFGIPNAAGTLCLRQGRIYANSVLGMDKAPRFSDRCWLHVVPLNQGSARIALEATSGKVCAECTQLGSIKSQLKALFTLFKHHFTAAPVGEQSGKNEGQQCAHQDDGLRSKYAVGKRDTRVSEMSDAEGYRPNYG